MSANAIGAGLLRQEIETAASAAGLPLHALTVLAPHRDPYRLDTPAGHQLGKWFAEQAQRLLLPAQTIHLRGFHYLLVSVPTPKPNGTPYSNTDDDWTWLVEKAAKAARWLGHVPFDLIRDERNEPAETFTADSVRLTDPRELVLNAGEDCETLPAVVSLLPRLSWQGAPIASRQPFNIVLIGEKSSLGEVLRPIAIEVEGELLLPTGEATDTMIAEMAARADEDGGRWSCCISRTSTRPDTRCRSRYPVSCKRFVTCVIQA
jgi:hypothetical protein